MQSNAKNNNQKPSWFIKQRAIVIIVLAVLLLAFDLSPFGGNITFYSTWVRCGRKPVASKLSFDTSEVKSYIKPSAFEPIRYGTPDYFCTPLEAEQHGYSANPYSYDFPHLQKNQ